MRKTRKLSDLLRLSLILLVGSMLVPLLSATNAHADSGGAVFSLKPTNPDPARPETASYFLYDMKPGDFKNDDAYAINTGSIPVHLRVYTADGATAHNGGITFPNFDVPRTGTGNWVQIDKTDITLEPGQSEPIKIQVAVPAGAPPKQYVAGIILENVDVVKGSGGVSVNVVQRTGTAVVMTVSGPTDDTMVIDGVTAAPNGNTSRVSATLHNVGNRLVYPTSTTIDVLDKDGNVTKRLTGSTPGTILPGDSIEVWAADPNPPKAGTYSFFAKAYYDQGKIAVWPKPEQSLAPVNPITKVEDPSGNPLEKLPGKLELSVSPEKEETVVKFPVKIPPGGTIGAVSDQDGTISYSNGVLTMPLDPGTGETGMTIIVQVGAITPAPNGAVGEVKSITVKTPETAGTFEGAGGDIDSFIAWAEAETRTLDVGTVVKFDVVKNTSDREQVQMRDAASRAGLSITNIACILNTGTRGVKSLFDLGDARVILLLQGSWVAEHGISNVRMVGITSDGQARVLETRVTLGDDGRYRIEALSPEGYASFGLVAVTPVSNSSTLFIIVTIAILMILVVLFLFLIWRRRRKKKEEDQHPPPAKPSAKRQDNPAKGQA